MIPEIGHFSLILALVASFYQMVFGVMAARTGGSLWRVWARRMPWVSVLFLSMAFACLVWSYWVSDFSVANVFANSHTQKPALYKLTGTWGNHEGSLVLWCLFIAVFTLAFTKINRYPSEAFFDFTLSIQGFISLLFVSFSTFASSPFLRLSPAPLEGRGLNPLLQDPALALHPPMLYAGYVGLSLTFSCAVAGLLSERIDREWARCLRPWVLISWCFLTLGIALGSWWAYYELGWGGFWFWDPVENASLMPWLAATALLHTLRVVEVRDTAKTWTVLLAILAFSFSLLGAFLVRSGILTSVHTFAVDTIRGHVLLAILFLLTGMALGIYAWRAPGLLPSSAPPGMRGVLLLLNSVFLLATLASVAIGTLYPLILDGLWSIKLSVGAPYFEKTFVPIVAFMLIFLPFSILVSWKEEGRWAVVRVVCTRLFLAFLGSVLCASLVWAFLTRGPWGAALGFALGFWVIFGSLYGIVRKIPPLNRGVLAFFRGIIALPLPFLGMTTAHIGVGVMIFGLVGATALSQERLVSLAPGERATFSGLEITFSGLFEHRGPNYTAQVGRFMVEGPSLQGFEMISEKRVFSPSGQPTTEVGLAHFWSGDLYLALGEPTLEGAWRLRFYFFPVISLIWLGAILMALGGVFVLLAHRPMRRSPVKEEPSPCLPSL